MTALINPAHLYIKFFDWKGGTYCTGAIFEHVENAKEYGYSMLNHPNMGYKAFHVYSIHKTPPLYIGVFINR